MNSTQQLFAGLGLVKYAAMEPWIPDVTKAPLINKGMGETANANLKITGAPAYPNGGQVQKSPVGGVLQYRPPTGPDTSNMPHTPVEALRQNIRQGATNVGNAVAGIPHFMSGMLDRFNHTINPQMPVGQASQPVR